MYLVKRRRLKAKTRPINECINPRIESSEKTSGGPSKLRRILLVDMNGKELVLC
jgi:hypothetical protein